MAITQKLLIGISSNFLHSINTSIYFRKCNKNWGDFGAIFEKKHGYFLKIGQILKMAITQKLLIGISSNFLHSISTKVLF